jgi:5-methylcytosine-specific restriction endonuclease McrA
MPRIFRAKPQTVRIVKPKEKGPREKGYNSRWDRASAAFRKRNPFCAFCLQRGRMTLIVTGRTGVVDHKWPVSDGGPMWDTSNWHSLCSSCHGSTKRAMEIHARETGQLDQLIRWCDDPASRPLLRGDTG